MVNQRPFYERRFALPLRLLPCGVRGGQPKGEPPLADFKFHAARVRVCVGLAAALRVLCPANAVSRFLRSALWVWTSMMRRAELFQCFQTFLRFFEKISEWMGLI